LIEPLPIFFLIYCIGKLPLIVFCILFLLVYTAYISIYEIGYFENDSFTIMNEENPFLRLNDNELTFVLKNFKKIEFFRWLIAVILLILTYLLGSKFNISMNLMLFCLLLVSTRVIFLIHNVIRNRWNILTMFLLSSSKYLSIPFLFLEFHKTTILSIILILIHPFPRTLEYASKRKYKFSIIRSITKPNRPLFRLAYYTVLFSATLFFFLANSDRNIYLYLAILSFGYFGAYRFLIFLLKLT
jgi:hypothetical protein